MNAAAVTARQLPPAVRGLATHPNDVDMRRIVRLLAKRERYRYVNPIVDAYDNGYLVQSPCCSRNVDAEGGVIDIAWLEYDNVLNAWKLHRKDHANGGWLLYGFSERLADAVDYLVHDPRREFWP